MFERIRRSWALLRASAAILAEVPHLLIFPVVALVMALVVVVSFLGLLGGASTTLAHLYAEWLDPTLAWALVAGSLYLVQYTVIFFCNVALIGAVAMRLEGGTPRIIEGFRMATARSSPIDAIRESASLLRRTWGENAVG